VISLTFGVYLALTLPAIAPARACLAEHQVEGLHNALVTAVALAQPAHLVAFIGRPFDDGEHTVTLGGEIILQRAAGHRHPWPAGFISTGGKNKIFNNISFSRYGYNYRRKASQISAERNSMRIIIVKVKCIAYIKI